MCSRNLLWLEKLLQWNRHVNGTNFKRGLISEGSPWWNCHENRMTFQSGLRFQTCLSSLRVSCKRALQKNKSNLYAVFGFLEVFCYSQKSWKYNCEGVFLYVSSRLEINNNIYSDMIQGQFLWILLRFKFAYLCFEHLMNIFLEESSSSEVWTLWVNPKTTK